MIGIDKFSWAQMFNNSKGKSSGMLLVCIYAGIVSITSFGLAVAIMVVTVVFALINKVSLASVMPTDILNFLGTIMFQSLALFTSALAGLGARRFTKDKEIIKEENEAESKSEEVPKDDV